MTNQNIPTAYKLKSSNVGMLNAKMIGETNRAEASYYNSIFDGKNYNKSTSNSSVNTSSLDSTTKTMNTIAIVGAFASMGTALAGMATSIIDARKQRQAAAQNTNNGGSGEVIQSKGILKDEIDNAEKTHDYTALKAGVEKAWADYHTKQAELGKAETAITTANSDIETADGTIKETKANIDAATKEIGTAKDGLKAAKQGVSAAEEKVAAAKTPEEKTAAEKELATATEAQKTAQAALDDAEAKKVKLEEKLKTVDEPALEKAKQSLKDATAQKGTIEKSIADLKKGIDMANKVLEKRGKDVKPSTEKKEEVKQEQNQEVDSEVGNHKQLDQIT